MFGLKDGKGGDEEAAFDLEMELKSPQRVKELRDEIQQRMLKIKSMLRDGQGPQDYNRFGILLHGYASLLKVVGRVNKK